jgi:hypothetical protein
MSFLSCEQSSRPKASQNFRIWSFVRAQIPAGVRSGATKTLGAGPLKYLIAMFGNGDKSSYQGIAATCF